MLAQVLQQEAPLIEVHKAFIPDLIALIDASQNLIVLAIAGVILLRNHESVKEMVTPAAVSMLVGAITEAQKHLIDYTESTDEVWDDKVARLAGEGIDVLVAALRELGHPVPDDSVVAVDKQIFDE